MKNLKQRVDRHLNGANKIHWHIDYLLKNEYTEIVDIKLFESDEDIFDALMLW